MTPQLEVPGLISSLLPTARRRLGHDELGLLARLDNYSAPFLKEKFSGRDEFPDVFTEFKKYVALAGFVPRPLAMTSEVVDEVWHQFILFTRNYSSFCTATLGRYLHHEPGSEETPIRPEEGFRTARAYRSFFGDAPAHWKFDRFLTVISPTDDVSQYTPCQSGPHCGLPCQDRVGCRPSPE